MSAPPEARAAAASLRLAAAAAWWVVRGRLSAHYPRVLQLLGALKAAAPGLVRPRHHARLCLGLRAKVIVEMILEGQPWALVLDALNLHFPASGPPECSSKAVSEASGLGRQPADAGVLSVLEGCPSQLRCPDVADVCAPQTPQSTWDLKVAEAREGFCQRVKQLAEDPEDSAGQLQELEQDYGEPFLVALEKLLFEYLCQLEKTLPVLQLQELKEVLRGMQSETLVPLALTQYCMDMGWLIQESPPFTSMRGAEPQEQSPLPSPQVEQVFQDPVPTAKPSTPFPQRQDLWKPPEALTGRDFNLAPLGRRQIQGNCASARGGHKNRPTVMLFPFRSMCLPVQDVTEHGNSRDHGQPMGDPASTMATRSIPHGKYRNSARSLRGRAQEQENWNSDEPSSEQKENCLDYSLEPLRPPLPAVGAREPVYSPSLCSPVVTIGDLVLDSDDEGSGQRGGKKRKQT
ncbi:TERF1-interacting nuclear factor 2 isoform X5 [Notamacropus eugenii]|uniref:TERF1-interacting nuclear factor 2 isoform X5 n=1 Tax=Notamacropus eugenii TaxID=9315 RepID=UPI003B684E6C